MLCCRRHFQENKMEKVRIVEEEFGLTKQPSTQETEQVKRFTFTNRNGVSVQVSHTYTNIHDNEYCFSTNYCVLSNIYKKAVTAELQSKDNKVPTLKN